MSNCPIRPLATNWYSDVWTSGRIQAAPVQVQSQWIKVGAFYGYTKDAHTRAVKEKIDILLQNLTQRIVKESQGFRAIVGDFNAT